MMCVRTGGPTRPGFANWQSTMRYKQRAAMTRAITIAGFRVALRGDYSYKRYG